MVLGSTIQRAFKDDQQPKMLQIPQLDGLWFYKYESSTICLFYTKSTVYEIHVYISTMQVIAIFGLYKTE